MIGKESDLFDEAIIQDFRNEFEDYYESTQNILLALEKKPDDQEQLRALFRIAHTLKGNLSMPEVSHIAGFVHLLENVLEDIRNGTLAFNNRMSDLFLLGMERVRKAFDDTLSGKTTDGLEEIKRALTGVRAGNPDREHNLERTLALLDSGYAVMEEEHNPHFADLKFFGQLAEFLERRVRYKSGSTERILSLAMSMNAISEGLIDPDQLRVGVYMHDIGMSFLPLDLLNKEGPFSDAERMRVETHPGAGAQLLTHLEYWWEARQIVHQHHERVDGQGYPDSLTGDRICDGAKVLAIADTFDSMTHQRPDRKHKRPFLRAVAEINSNSGTQFEPRWVDIFNQAVRQYYIKTA